MMQATCISCGEYFWRDHDEGWKRLCLECWKARKNHPGNLSWTNPSELAWLRARVRALESMRDVLQDEIDRLQGHARIGEVVQTRAKDLLFLVHPDKHGGDRRALEISQWLNGEVRR